MDSFILLMTLISCIVYIAAQTIVFRLIHEDRALMWLVKLYFFVEALSLITGYLMLPEQLTVSLVLWHGTLFTLFVVSYIQSIFSFLEASVSVRLLTEIARGGKRGVTKDGIRKTYNRNIIVRRRIARFLAGGDIVLQKSSYRWVRTISPFIIRTRITDLTEVLFPRKYT
jgi:hypothetical protein